VTQLFQVGDRAEVVAIRFGHGFKIGEIIQISFVYCAGTEKEHYADARIQPKGDLEFVSRPYIHYTELKAAKPAKRKGFR